MFAKISIGRYYSVKSKIHDLNPLAKLICTLIFISSLFISDDILVQVLLIVLTAIMISFTNVPYRVYYNAVSGIKLLLIIVLVFGIITREPGLIIIITCLRLILIVIYTSILTLTTPPTEITYGLEQLFYPLTVMKIPIKKMALAITLALRFIPMVIDQGQRILKSQASRGIDYQNSRFEGKIMAISSMLLPMFILSFKRAGNLADSMEVRLYGINRNRTNYRVNKWGWVDTLMIMFHILPIIAYFVNF